MENAVDQSATIDTTTATGATDDGGSDWINELMGDGAETAVDTTGEITAEIADDTLGETTDETEDQDQDGEDDLIELKVYGKSVKLSPDEVVELAQKQMAAETKLEDVKEQARQIAAERQKFEETRESFKSFLSNLASPDPATHVEIYEQLRRVIPSMPSFQQVVEAFVDREIEWHRMPDHERQMKIIERERAKLEAERKRIQDEVSSRTTREQQQQAYQTVMQTLPVAMQEAGLPQSPAVIKRIAEVWRDAVQRDQRLPPEKRMNPDAKKVVAIVKAEREKDRMDDLAALSEDELLTRLPPDVLRKLGKAQVQQVRDKFRKAGKTVSKPVTAPTVKTGNQYKTASEFFKERGL